MNPLSSHPPRTPRASLVSSQAHVYAADTYESTEEPEKSLVVDEEFDENEERAKEIARRVRKEDIWREMLSTSRGRDKIFVIILSCFLGYIASDFLCFRN